MTRAPLARGRGTRPLASIIATTLVALAAGPGTAFAGTATVTAGELRFTAAPGEANNLFVRDEPANGTLLVSDYANATAPGLGCARLTDRQVRCASAGITSIFIDTGDGNDRIENRTSLPSRLLAGDGDDVIVGGNTDDVIEAGSGNDTVSGRGGSDTVTLGDGDDRSVDNGGTRDVLSCGNGVDQAVHDANDVVAADCEQRFLTVPSGAPPAGAPTLPPPPPSTPGSPGTGTTAPGDAGSPGGRPGTTRRVRSCPGGCAARWRPTGCAARGGRTGSSPSAATTCSSASRATTACSAARATTA